MKKNVELVKNCGKYLGKNIKCSKNTAQNQLIKR